MEINPPRGANRAGRTVRNPADPISRYNLVMRCYNRPYHIVSNTPLSPLPCAALYRLTFPLTTLRLLWALVICYMLPYLNFAVLAWVGFMWILYERAYKVAVKNRRLVPNALQNMVLSPAVCSLFHVSNVFLTLPIEQITATLDLSRRRTAQNEYIVMFYSEGFRAWYSELRQWRYHHLLHVLLGAFLCLISYFFLYPAIGFDPIGAGRLRNKVVH